MEQTHVEATEETLTDALDVAEREEARFHIREALQHVVVLRKATDDD